ncbi:MAG: GntR family transcriptional regulator [Acidimicrobiia bacterium]
MIALRLDPRSGVPPYLQLAEQVREALVAGRLEPGDQLPTVREVVARLAVNPNTVFKAYRQLEHEGLVEGRPGAGTFVLRRPSGPDPASVARLRRSLARWIERARADGFDDRAIEALVRSELRADTEEATA